MNVGGSGLRSGLLKCNRDERQRHGRLSIPAEAVLHWGPPWEQVPVRVSLLPDHWGSGSVPAGHSQVGEGASARDYVPVPAQLGEPLLGGKMGATKTLQFMLLDTQTVFLKRVLESIQRKRRQDVRISEPVNGAGVIHGPYGKRISLVLSHQEAGLLTVYGEDPKHKESFSALNHDPEGMADLILEVLAEWGEVF
jgi:hypothetical protein